MKAVILAGGLGTRISEETHLKPKPMIEIGGKPILWHIMKQYSAHGVHEFVICCGYKGYVIKEYFANYFLHMSDVTFDMQSNQMEVHQRKAEPWRVTLVDTGEETMTGGRLKRVADYLKDEEAFCFTYGDGVSDVDISTEIAFHKQHGKLATVVAVRPPGRYGALQMAGTRVTGFTEKPRGDGGLINGGFFVLSPRCIDLIAHDQSSWEGEPLTRLSQQGELMAFEHNGFWQPMDTLRKISWRNSGPRPSALEGLVMNREFWRGKRVLLTGHTGFKGGWLSLWLADMGAQVHGYALTPPTDPNFFTTCDLASRLAGNTLADIRDADALTRAMQAARPDVVLHLAAQPLVRYSYTAPVETYAVNVMGTVNLLEAVRQTPGVRAMVNITTDKCYENREWVWSYRENEAMGGADPYSSSKACSELVTAAWRASFLDAAGIQLASARAGNVIGGGDWAADRLIPDFLRAIDAGRTLNIRSPLATRPWQHVLEPLAGYLMLAEKLCEDGAAFAEGWNFGPDENDAKPVRWIVEYLCDQVPEATWQCDASPQPHEANMLKLDSSKAKARLGWRPHWNLQTALGQTLAWHQAWKAGADMAQISLSQIAAYESNTSRA